MQAPNDELNKAIDRWFSIQTTNPSWLDNYIYKQNGGLNPFYPWPPEKEEVDKFLFASQSFEQAAKAMTPEKRQELVKTFNEGSQRAEAFRAEAREGAKKRVQEVIKYTIEEPSVPPEQKPLLYQALEAKSESEPQRTVAELVPEAIEVGEVAQAFLNPKAGVEASGPTSFKNLRGLSAVQKNITAAGVDALTQVFPDLRRGAFNRMVGDSLQKMIDNTDFLTKKFGSDFLAQPWFTQVQRDAGRIVGQGAAHGGAKNALEDVISSLFRGPADQTTLAIMEAYRVNVMQGLPPPNFNQLRAAHMGIGSELFKFGVGEAKGWAVRKGLTALGVKLAAGTAIGPVGWAALAFDFLAGRLGKFGNWLKGLAMPRAGEVPGDRWILGGIGCILSIMIILPLVIQMFIIDNAIIGRLQMGGPGEGGSPLPPYPGAPTIPGDVTGCPTKQAYTLTQCPGSSDYSHANLWAYDLGFSGAMGMPIYATHNGVVAATTGELQSGGYGNMVEIKGTTPAGTAYYTLYGHLVPRWVVRPGQQVKAGDIIGYGDDTGNSSGPHLHYEYRDAQNRTGKFGIQFMPAACVTNPGYCSLQ